jgi:hypothetical protein
VDFVQADRHLHFSSLSFFALVQFSVVVLQLFQIISFGFSSAFFRHYLLLFCSNGNESRHFSIENALFVVRENEIV